MKNIVFLFIVYILMKEDAVISLRISELRAPGQASEGSDVTLACLFDLEGEKLYALKWYKDDKQFYRYIEDGESPQAFPMSGVHVDLTKSSKDTIVLKNVNSSCEGTYLCEIQGEAPRFTLASASKYITIYLLPDGGPIISEGKDAYRVGEIAEFNCTSKASRPSTQLQWWINDELAPSSYLRGPWVHPAHHLNASITTLSLTFRVTDKYFHNSKLDLRCEATVAPLFNMDTAIHLTSALLNPTPGNDLSFEKEPNSSEIPACWMRRRILISFIITFLNYIIVA